MKEPEETQPEEKDLKETTETQPEQEDLKEEDPKAEEKQDKPTPATPEEPKEIVELWSKAEQVHRPKKWVSDGLKGYYKAYSKVFGTKYKDRKVEWIRHSHRETGKFNFSMERLMRNLKDRLRTVYGFKATWSAKQILEGWIIYYNFIRPHMGIEGKTPAAMAGLRIGSGGWLQVINNSVS